MNERQRARLIAHGALVFLAGMVAGMPFAFEIMGRVELWPIPGSVVVDMPGDVRGWRMAHLEGILNGLLLISVAAVGDRLRLTERGANVVTIGLLVCAWGNIVASWLGPLFGVRGLNWSGATVNSIVYLLFVAAIVGILAAMWNVYRGASARLRELDESGDPGPGTEQSSRNA